MLLTREPDALHKSTCLNLISAKPNKMCNPHCPGEILIDNHNIKDLDLKFLRRNVGAVSQEPSLFAGTIKDNLMVGKMDANDQEIENASTTANAHSFISQLPDQYSTEVIDLHPSYSLGTIKSILVKFSITRPITSVTFMPLCNVTSALGLPVIGKDFLMC